MHIDKLILKDYRNYDKISLEFENRVNLILGENAQGKTNLMEAIFVLAMAKSHRTPRDKEMIRWDQQFAKVEGHLKNKNGPLHMEVVFSDKGKKVKINHIEQKRMSDYIGGCNIVMFAPEDLALVKGSPQVRRRFLDMEMGQIHPIYLYHLSQYHKILKQRNQWLKDVMQKKVKPDAAMLDVITEQLYREGAQVITKRIAFIKKLQSWAQPIHQEITRGKESLEIGYLPSCKVSEDMDLSTMMIAMEQQYSLIKEREIQRGITLIGPHRDDLTFTINRRDVQTYGSQGQQRTTALSLKLAEIELIFQKKGEYPILLLDDVLSELDEQRQIHLLNTIRGKVQTFVTTTHVESIDHQIMLDAEIFYVDEGSVKRTK